MDYDGLSTKAKSLIQTYGTSLTLQRPSFSSFSPTLGSYSSETYTDYSVYGVIRSPGRMYSGDRFYGGVQIESGDREIVIATQATVTPDVGDLVKIAGVPYRIITVLPVSPGGTDLLYKTLCRR